MSSLEDRLTLGDSSRISQAAALRLPELHYPQSQALSSSGAHPMNIQNFDISGGWAGSLGEGGTSCVFIAAL